MKYGIFLCGALALGASFAHADYVCQVALVPPGEYPTQGNAGQIYLRTSTQQNCGGAFSPQWILLCSKGSTDSLCGAHAQFSEVTLSSTYEAIHDAQMKQQVVYPQLDTCNGGNAYACNNSVMFQGP